MADTAEAAVGPKATRREWIGLGVRALPCVSSGEHGVDATPLALILAASAAKCRDGGRG